MARRPARARWPALPQRCGGRCCTQMRVSASAGLRRGPLQFPPHQPPHPHAANPALNPTTTTTPAACSPTPTPGATRPSHNMSELCHAARVRVCVSFSRTFLKAPKKIKCKRICKQTPSKSDDACVSVCSRGAARTVRPAPRAHHGRPAHPRRGIHDHGGVVVGAGSRGGGPSWEGPMALPNHVMQAGNPKPTLPTGHHICQGMPRG